MPSPRENPALWDYVVIGKVTLPPDGVDGHVKVTVKPKVKDDKKSPAGKNGGRTTTQGLDLADVDIELEFPDAPGQYALVQAAMDAIWPPPSEAQGIAHGATDLWGIRDITVRAPEGPAWADGKGVIKLGCREWRPDPKTSGGGGGSGMLSLAELKARLAAAEAKLKALNAAPIQSATDIDAAASEVYKWRNAISNFNAITNTPTTSSPTKQWSKGGGVPLGEIQPGDRVPLGEIQP